MVHSAVQDRITVASMHSIAVFKRELRRVIFPVQSPQLTEPPTGSKLCGGEKMAMSTRDYRMPVKYGATHRNSEAGAVHPALPAVVLLMSFAVFMAAIAPMDFSSIVRKLFPSPSQTVPHQNAAVWADNGAGVYYCADSIMFGKSHGEYMKQVDALDRGYQPALGTYCTGPAWDLQSEPIRLPAAAPAPAPAPNIAATPGDNPFEKPPSPTRNPALPTAPASVASH